MRVRARGRIGRLTGEWQAEYGRWQARDLSVDGIYLQARMEDRAACRLVLLGATPEGKKELIGFWKALDEVFPGTRHHRCWLHKVMNVLDRVPKSVQGRMKADLRQISSAPTRAAADKAIAVFVEKYGAKYSKAVDCLSKDSDAPLTFFDLPAERRGHLRTTNPIVLRQAQHEAVFATVRHGTVRTKGALSPTTAKLRVFKLVMAAARTWRRLKGEKLLPEVVAGVTFKDETEVIDASKDRAA